MHKYFWQIVLILLLISAIYLPLVSSLGYYKAAVSSFVKHFTVWMRVLSLRFFCSILAPSYLRRGWNC
jgi:hypothetical protein